MAKALADFFAEVLEHGAPPKNYRRERDRSLSHRRLGFGCYWPMMRAAYSKLRLLAIVRTEHEPAIAQGNGQPRRQKLPRATGLGWDGGVYHLKKVPLSRRPHVAGEHLGLDF